MSKEKTSLTYKKGKLKIMMGKKELDLMKVLDPAVIVLSSDEVPTLNFKLVLDELNIDDINLKKIGDKK